MSAVLTTDLPEILYVDRHSQASQLGKQNIVVDPKEQKETNMSGNKQTTKNKTNKQKYLFFLAVESLKPEVDVHYFRNIV